MSIFKQANDHEELSQDKVAMGKLGEKRVSKSGSGRNT